MSFKKFLFSKVFLIQLAIAVGVLIVLLIFTMRSINSYTHHGETLEVPDFSEMTIDELPEVEKGELLRFSVIDSAYVKGAVPGSIIKQTPEAGTQVKQNRRIFLTIAAQNPEKVNMPRLTDISLRQAKAMLEKSGLNMGEVIYRPSQYLNVVLGQLFEGNPIAPESKVSKGSVIDLVVGQGPSSEKVIVPDITGMTVEEAQQMLENITLTLGVLIYDGTFETEEDSINTKIWKQKPEVNSRVGKGASIDCWLLGNSENEE